MRLYFGCNVAQIRKMTGTEENGIVTGNVTEKAGFYKESRFFQTVPETEQSIAHTLKNNVQFAKKKYVSFGIL